MASNTGFIITKKALKQKGKQDPQRNITVYIKYILIWDNKFTSQQKGKTKHTKQHKSF